MHNNRKTEKALSLLVVIPIMLVLFIFAFLFIELVQVRTWVSQNSTASAQTRFMAKTALQLALSEIRCIAELTDHARRGQTAISVSHGQAFPTTGFLLLGGHRHYPLTAYQKNGEKLTLSTPVKRNLPKGTRVYLGRDLDNNGQIGSINSMPYRGGRIEVQRQTQSKTPADTLQTKTPYTFAAKAVNGSAQWTIERTVVFF